MNFYRDNFKRMRESRGLTHGEIAQKINVSKQSVEHWEAGRSKPRALRIPDLAAVLGCDISVISDLISGPDELDTFTMVDDQLSFVIDSWGELSDVQKAEIIGMVKAFKLSKK